MNVQNIVSWKNNIITEMNPVQVQQLLDCRATGEAQGLLYAHPLRQSFTPTCAQFLTNILFTDAADVQALWEQSDEEYRLLQPANKPEDEVTLTLILNNLERLMLDILKRIFITDGSSTLDPVQHAKSEYAKEFDVCPSKFVKTQKFLTWLMIFCQNHNLSAGVD